MSLRDTMKRAADKEQVKLKPLPEHLIASLPEHLRQHYALLLAALLSAQTSISETQTRLTCLLLDSLQIGDIRGALFEQARELGEEITVEAARLIRDAGLARHLLVDALILLRLDKPIDEDISGLISELAAFLDVDDKNLGACSRVAARILGLGVARSDAAAKKWPGIFDGIGKPVAHKPIVESRSATATPKAPEKKAAKSTAPTKAAAKKALKKPIAKKAPAPKKTAAKKAPAPRTAATPGRTSLNPQAVWPFFTGGKPS